MGKMIQGKLEKILDGAIVISGISYEYPNTEKIPYLLINRNIEYLETKKFYMIRLNVNNFTYFSTKIKK